MSHWRKKSEGERSRRLQRLNYEIRKMEMYHDEKDKTSNSCTQGQLVPMAGFHLAGGTHSGY